MGTRTVKSEQAQAEEEIPVDLKNPALAAFLAWLVPGLGHFYQQRTAKAILFFVCIVSTFAYGVYLGSGEGLGVGRVVYASWRETDRRLPYLCQIGVGLPALPALIQARRVRNGQDPLFGQFMSPPRLSNISNDQGDPPTVDRLHRELHRYFDIGTAYTMIAGLLNILAIYDAWGGPVFTEYGKEDDEEEDQDQDEGESEKSSNEDA